MQLTTRSSGEDAWRVLAVEVGGAAIFVALPAPANDLAAPLDAAPAEGGLLGAIARAASWLMAETIFGFAVYGAATHPSVLDPGWNPCDGADRNRDSRDDTAG